MGTEEFYTQIGKMIKDRDHARAMAEKWSAKATELETDIENLIQQKEGNDGGLSG